MSLKEKYNLLQNEDFTLLINFHKFTVIMNDFKNIDNQLCDSDGIRTRTVIPDQGIFNELTLIWTMSSPCI